MYDFFRKGIEPAWEDEQNAYGGRFQIRYNKSQNPNISNKFWEDLLLGLIGEQFSYPDEINGIVISIRNNQDTISIWNKSGDDLDIIKQIKLDVIKICGMTETASMDYE